MIMGRTKISGIYCIENITNNKKYIGQSVNIYDRWYKHKHSLRQGNHDNDFLQKSWNRHGEECFKFYILEECDKDSLDEKEKYYIELYNTLDENCGYNLKKGGQDGVISIYGKIKQRESLKKAYQNPDLIELRKQDALKQWSNPEIIAKHMGKNNGMYGKTHTTEAREKIAQAQRGRKSPKRINTPVYCVELDRVFESAAEAKNVLNINSPILEVCYGNRKTAGGYHWEFYRKVI